MITVFNEIIQLAKLNMVREIKEKFEKQHSLGAYNGTTFNSIMLVLSKFEKKCMKGFDYGDEETENGVEDLEK